MTEKEEEYNTSYFKKNFGHESNNFKMEGTMNSNGVYKIKDKNDLMFMVDLYFIKNYEEDQLGSLKILINNHTNNNIDNIDNIDINYLTIFLTHFLEIFPIDKWDTSNVTDMSNLFMNQTEDFHEGIGKWNVSNVTNMSNMFWDSKKFNQPIGEWNVSNVTNMSNMFSGAEMFNQNIGKWNVKNVTNMSFMFYNTKMFNQPIGSWERKENKTVHATTVSTLSNVEYMHNMFCDAYAFKQDISNWNIGNVNNFSEIFARTHMPNETLTNIYNEWLSKVLDNYEYNEFTEQNFYNEFSIGCEEKLTERNKNVSETDFAMGLQTIFNIDQNPKLPDLPIEVKRLISSYLGPYFKKDTETAINIYNLKLKRREKKKKKEERRKSILKNTSHGGHKTKSKKRKTKKRNAQKKKIKKTNKKQRRKTKKRKTLKKKQSRR